MKIAGDEDDDEEDDHDDIYDDADDNDDSDGDDDDCDEGFPVLAPPRAPGLSLRRAEHWTLVPTVHSALHTPHSAVHLVHTAHTSNALQYYNALQYRALL